MKRISADLIKSVASQQQQKKKSLIKTDDLRNHKYAF